MEDNGLHGPPKPTTPENAPWTDVQSILTKLDQLIATLQVYNTAIVQLISQMTGSNITVNVPTLAGTAPAPIPTGVTDYVDSGKASGGSTTNLQDTSKAWQPGTLQGAFLFITMGAQTYQTTILSNTNNQLTFTALAVAVTSGMAYNIRHAVFGNKGSFVTGKAVITTAGTPVNLPNIPIPAGTAAILMAYPGNGGNIFIGNSSANVLKSSPDPTTGNQRFEYLAAGDSIPIKEINLNEYWVDTSNSGDSVTWII